MLGVDQVVGTRRADLADLGRAHGRGERDRLGAPVDLEHEPVGVGEERAAERGKGLREEEIDTPFVALRDLPAAQAEPALRRRLDRARGARDELDRGLVALVTARAPGDEAVLLEQDGARGRLLLEELGDPARHVEARPLVVEPDGLVAERLVGEPPPVGRRGQRDHRVGVRVVDVRGRDERVEQGLDRRPRLVRPQRAAEKVVDHLGVVHRLAVAQRQELVEPQSGEARRRDRREIGARALDPERSHLAAGVIAHGLLRGRVPAALVRERPVGAEQVRAVDEPVEHRQARGAASVPAVDRRRDALQRVGALGHADTSSPTVAAGGRSARAPPPLGDPSGSYAVGPNEARTTLARLGERCELAERDRLHEEVAEQRRLLRSGQDGEAGGVGGPRAEQLVPRAAPDDVEHRELRAGRARDEVDRLRVLEREALEDAPDERTGIGRLRLAGSRAESPRSRSGMSPGAAKPGSFGSMSETKREPPARARPARRSECSVPSAAQFRRHSCEEPQARDVAKHPEGPLHATLVASGSPQTSASSISGPSVSTPTSDHVPTLRNTPPAPVKGTPATAEPVSCVATATTTVPTSPVSSATSAERSLTAFPEPPPQAETRTGTSSRSSRSLAQSPARGSKHCVVVAFVSSVVRLPQSR